MMILFVIPIVFLFVLVFISIFSITPLTVVIMIFFLISNIIIIPFLLIVQVMFILMIIVILFVSVVISLVFLAFSFPSFMIGFCLSKLFAVFFSQLLVNEFFRIRLSINLHIYIYNSLTFSGFISVEVLSGRVSEAPDSALNGFLEFMNTGLFISKSST